MTQMHGGHSVSFFFWFVGDEVLDVGKEKIEIARGEYKL